MYRERVSRSTKHVFTAELRYGFFSKSLEVTVGLFQQNYYEMKKKFCRKTSFTCDNFQKTTETGNYISHFYLLMIIILSACLNLNVSL